MNTRAGSRGRVELLASAVDAARETNFWRRKIGNDPITSMPDFKRLPIVETGEYRKQRFADLIAIPDEIDWIPGPWLGQSPNRAPVAEGATEARLRVRILRRGLSQAVPDDIHDPTAVVISTFENRYFGAEMCVVFVRMGIPAHLVTDSGTDRINELVSIVEPDIVAVFSDQVDTCHLPGSVRRLVTVGSAGIPGHIPVLDLYVCNEFGVLGIRNDGGEYRLAHDYFYFETSPEGTLVVTPYFSRIQPIIRLDTGDRIRVTAPSDLC